MINQIQNESGDMARKSSRNTSGDGDFPATLGKFAREEKKSSPGKESNADSVGENISVHYARKEHTGVRSEVASKTKNKPVQGDILPDLLVMLPQVDGIRNLMAQHEYAGINRPVTENTQVVIGAGDKNIKDIIEKKDLILPEVSVASLLNKNGEELAVGASSARSQQEHVSYVADMGSDAPSRTIMVPEVAGNTVLRQDTPSSSPVSVVPATLSQPLGTQEWQQSLSQQLSLFTRNGVHHAELRLHPEELGSLRVNLRFNSDRVSLHFMADNHLTREALESAMPHLHASLAESGIHLEQSSFDADSPAPSSFFSTPDQSGSTGQHRYQDRDKETIAPSSDEQEITLVHTLSHVTGINTFA